MQSPDIDEYLARYPRLCRAMQHAALLSRTEAAAALRDYCEARSAVAYGADLLRWGGGEAVAHFGGPLRVLRAGIRLRHSSNRRHLQ